MTFLDLIEVRFVKEFLGHGVTLHTIRQVQKAAASEFKVRHPFCVKRFETDGETILQRFRENGDDRLLDRKRDQFVHVSVFNPLLKRID